MRYSCLFVCIFGIGLYFVSFDFVLFALICYGVEYRSPINAFVWRMPKNCIHFVLIRTVGRAFVCSVIHLIFVFAFGYSDSRYRSIVSLVLAFSSFNVLSIYKWTLIHSKGIIVVYSVMFVNCINCGHLNLNIIKSIVFVGENGRALIRCATLFIFIFRLVLFSIRFRWTHAHCVTSNALTFLNKNTLHVEISRSVHQFCSRLKWMRRVRRSEWEWNKRQPHQNV